MKSFSVWAIGISTPACLLLAACSTMTHQNSASVQGARVHSSLYSVKGDAPAAMSIPDTNHDAVVDPAYMRSQADYHYAMGEAHSLDGETDKAIEEFRLALIYNPSSATLHLSLARQYVKKGLLSEAMAQTKQALKLAPSNPDVHMLLGGLYSGLQSNKKAIAEYKQVLKLDPKKTKAAIFIGAILAEQKKYSDAIQYFRHLSSNTNDEAVAYLADYYAGGLYQEENSPKANQLAVEEYRKSIALKPDFDEAVLALADLLTSMHRSSEATTLLANYQDKYGPDPNVAADLAPLYMKSKSYQLAYEQFQILQSNDDTDLDVKMKMALILIQEQHYHKAAAKLNQILAQVPNANKIRFYLAAVYEQVKDYKHAIGEFTKIPLNSSFYPDSVIHSAYLYKKLGDYRMAIKTIKKGIANDDKVPQFYSLYASFLDGKQQYQKGIALLKKAVIQFPQSTQLLYMLGAIYGEINDTHDTIATMKAVLKLNDRHVEALNYLAYTYAQNNIHLNKAEKLARRALKYQPNDGYILDTLGYILYKENRLAESIKILEMAYHDQSSEGIIAEHLGDAYYKSQLPEKARLMYLKAVGTEKDAKELEKIRAKIAAIDSQQAPVSAVDTQPRRSPTSVSSAK